MFINAHLFDYCTARKITFTRARPDNKNDGAHVKQKNWTHVRELVGYLRFDTEVELGVLNSIWELDRGYTNLILTQQNLLSRTRVGAKVIKRHDAAATPFERAVRSGVLSPAQRGGLTRTRNAIHPGELQREIARLCDRLEHLALSKALAPHRLVNRAFNASSRPEALREATNRSSRRI